MIDKSAPPFLGIPPFTRKRQKITVVISRKGRVSANMRASIVNGEIMRTNPRTKVRLVRLEPIISPIAS